MSLFMQKQGTGTASSKMSFWYIGQFSHKCRCPIHVLYNNICHTESPIEKPIEKSYRTIFTQTSHSSPIGQHLSHRKSHRKTYRTSMSHRKSHRKTYRTSLSHRSPIGFLQENLQDIVVPQKSYRFPIGFFEQGNNCTC